MNLATETLTLDTVTPPELEVVNMSKHFGALIALDQVSLKMSPGTFHALLGENGAGKSTLVKCIMGFYTPTHGDVLINKQSREILSPRDAHHYGIGMVYQHFTSVPYNRLNLASGENLVVPKTPISRLLSTSISLLVLALRRKADFGFISFFYLVFGAKRSVLARY
jgi:simple sugar transport system ATP-binding protein